MSNEKNLTIYDFSKICRTCLSEGEMKPLYENCTSEVCLVEMLMSCTFVQFKENDGLPVQICEECIKEIQLAYKFAKKCETSDETLRQCINHFKSKLRKKSSKEKKRNKNSDENTLRKTRRQKVSETENDAEIGASELEKAVFKVKSEPVLDTSDLENVSRLNTVDITVKSETITPKIELADFNEENTFSDSVNDFETDDEYVPNKKSETSPKRKKQIQKTKNCIKSENEFDDEGSETDNKDTIKNNKVKKKPLYKLKSQPPYECKKCFEKFPSFQLLKLHREEKQHPKNSYNRKICNICQKSVGYSRMNQHMRTHTQEKPYCCEVCGARFSISSNLRRHTLSRHSDEKPYKCVECDKGFTRLGLLKDHQRTHTGEKPFVCNFCGKAFAQSTTFRTHLFIHAKRGETTGQITGNEHECNDCKRCFATKALLKAHQLIHGEKRFLCSDCGRGFVSMILLKSHSKVHTGVKPYNCTTCNKTFSHIGSLKSHTLIHTGQKPFVCNVCNRAFTQRNHLKYHMRTHSGERPYICSVCGKTFALNGNLTVHMRTHTGETPYLCPICGKGFHDSSSMKKHKKGHAIQEDVISTVNVN